MQDACKLQAKNSLKVTSSRLPTPLSALLWCGDGAPQANGQKKGFIKANQYVAEVHLLSPPANYKLLTSISYLYSCWLQHNYNITDDYFIVAIVSSTLTAAFSNALSRYWHSSGLLQRHLSATQISTGSKVSSEDLSKWPSCNCLIHFYQRCVSFKPLTFWVLFRTEECHYIECPNCESTVLDTGVQWNSLVLGELF